MCNQFVFFSSYIVERKISDAKNEMEVNGMKKLLPVFDDISESIADRVEDFVDDIMDLF